MLLHKQKGALLLYAAYMGTTDYLPLPNNCRHFLTYKALKADEFFLNFNNGQILNVLYAGNNQPAG